LAISNETAKPFNWKFTKDDLIKAGLTQLNRRIMPSTSYTSCIRFRACPDPSGIQDAGYGEIAGSAH
jgi:hypothetical protein